MPFDWTNFLTIADELSQRGDEAAKRSAISRAYYAAFNPAFERAERTAGPFPRNQGSHIWCWTKYQNTNDAGCQQLGLTGSRMKRRRVHADYYSYDIKRIDDVVRRMLQDARNMRQQISALNPLYPSP